MQHQTNEPLSVNWENGIRITKEHFVDSDLFTNHVLQAYQKASITRYTYGIINTPSNSTESCVISFEKIATNQWRFQLQYCDAITAKAKRLYYDKESYESSLTFEYTYDRLHSNSSFFLCLELDAQEHVPVGFPKDSSNPVHKPYIVPKARIRKVYAEPISVENENTFMHSNLVILARIKVLEDKVILDQDYICPVSKSRFHSRLLAFHQNIGSSLTALEASVLEIHHTTIQKYKTSILAYHTSLLCKRILEFITQYQWDYTNSVILEESPVTLVRPLAQLAKSLYYELLLLPSEDLEHLLNYYYSWTQITPTAFKGMLEAVMNHTYYHTDIIKSVTQVESFLEMLQALWTQLAKLEYIGQQEDNLVTSENVSFQQRTQDTSYDRSPSGYGSQQSQPTRSSSSQPTENNTDQSNSNSSDNNKKPPKKRGFSLLS